MVAFNQAFQRISQTYEIQLPMPQSQLAHHHDHYYNFYKYYYLLAGTSNQMKFTVFIPGYSLIYQICNTCKFLHYFPEWWTDSWWSYQTSQFSQLRGRGNRILAQAVETPCCLVRQFPKNAISCNGCFILRLKRAISICATQFYFCVYIL